jgi:hypothetical protein
VGVPGEAPNGVVFILFLGEDGALSAQQKIVPTTDAGWGSGILIRICILTITIIIIIIITTIITIIVI